MEKVVLVALLRKADGAAHGGCHPLAEIGRKGDVDCDIFHAIRDRE